MKPNEKLVTESKQSIKVKIGKDTFRFFTDGSLYKIKRYLNAKQMPPGKKLAK